MPLICWATCALDFHSWNYNLNLINDQMYLDQNCIFGFGLSDDCDDFHPNEICYN
jgi:hypothetical protein